MRAGLNSIKINTKQVICEESAAAALIRDRATLHMGREESMAYKNFKTALYCPVGNLNEIVDIGEFGKRFGYIEKHVHIDKVYLETYRSNETIERERILELKKFFENKGMKVSGGITTTGGRHDEFGFTTICYSDAQQREQLRKVVEMTASIFDEIMFDDFYFTNCKCESCIKAKGDRSWSEFRLGLMKEVSEELIVGPAKKINPRVNMICKFPNWYECFQETGYNLEDNPRIFDMIYTGTETRDPMYTQQHLPKYLGYFIMRYFENVSPGKNGGGWFDTFECRGNLNYYVEQAYMTLFSKPREVTLFCLGALLDRRWSIFTPLAGYALEDVDGFLGRLGDPTGTACYIPYHSTGEEYLHGYIGMLGIPLEPYPSWPEGAGRIFLTESAASDGDIISKVDKNLREGSDVIVTSGFVKAMAGKGFEQLANIRWTGKKALIGRYGISKAGINLDGVAAADKPILLPWMNVSTNDAWLLAEGLGEDNNIPVMTAVNYGKGRLFVLTIPEDHGDLYHYPKEILGIIRRILRSNTSVTIDARAKVGLFTYDNDTFVVENFLPHPEDLNVIADRPGAVLIDLVSGKELAGTAAGNSTVFAVSLPQATYRAYGIK